MTSIAGGLNTGIWLCAVVLGATGSAIIVRGNTLTVYATPLMPVKPVL